MASTNIDDRADRSDHVEQMQYTEAALERDMARLRQEDQLADDALGRLFAEVADATVDRRPSWRERLRELPTPLRVALSVLAALGSAVATLSLTGTRTDVTGQAVLRYGIAMAAIVGLMGAAFSVSMRGMHRRPLGRLAWVVVLVVLAVPLVLAVMPWVWQTPAAPMAAGGQMSHVPCLVLGLLTGALTAAVAWVFQRQDWGAWWRAVAAVAGGGLTAFAMLQLHCPSTDPTHLLVCHAGAGLILAATVALVLLLRGRIG